VSAFRGCLQSHGYPASKEARLNHPTGAVPITVAGGSVSVGGGNPILAAHARMVAAGCASLLGGGSSSGVVVYH
jgi:hypothetical protein